jgi:hypothetical protein
MRDIFMNLECCIQDDQRMEKASVDDEDATEGECGCRRRHGEKSKVASVVRSPGQGSYSAMTILSLSEV